MTPRENLLALLRRQPHETIPVDFSFCPYLVEVMKEKTGRTDYADYFELPWRNVEDIRLTYDPEQYRSFYPASLREGTQIDIWGVAHEPGSAAAMHMTRMRHPMMDMEELTEIEAYPFPDFSKGDAAHQKEQVDSIHDRGLAAVGNMQVTIWETAWALRGMENLMTDMILEPEIAALIYDKVTEQAIIRAVSYAKAGADILFFGDDIGTQRSIMMSLDMYRTWLKPRLKQVIDAARAVNPDIIIFYHSCGMVTDFIPDLIECGINVLNPIQSECMDFKEIYEMYGDRVCFHGTIGTQTVMPFGTPEEVKACVKRHLDIARAHGGLFPAPTHVLEPEVPWENILAYVEACREYKL